MKIRIKYLNNLLTRNILELEFESKDSVSTVKRTIASLLGVPSKTIRLITYKYGIKVMMSDSWEIGFFISDECSTIKVDKFRVLTENSPRRLRRVSTYMDTNGYVNFFPSSRDYGLFDKVIDECKLGNLSELQRTVEIYEQDTPDEEDILNQAQKSF